MCPPGTDSTSLHKLFWKRLRDHPVHERTHRASHCRSDPTNIPTQRLPLNQTLCDPVHGAWLTYGRAVCATFRGPVCCAYTTTHVAYKCTLDFPDFDPQRVTHSATDYTNLQTQS